MQATYNAFSNRTEWAELKLKDYGDYGDYVEYVEQEEYGDGQLEGNWFYPDDEGYDDKTGQGQLVIYHGSFGNYNSPGASSYTYATVYDDREEYEEDLEEWENKEEYLESDWPICDNCGETYDVCAGDCTEE